MAPPSQSSRGLWKHLRKDGKLIYVDIISHAIQNEGKTSILILANDVTDKIIAEERLARAKNYSAPLY